MTHPYEKEFKQYRANELEYPIQPLLSHRWSPRAMTGAEMSDEELFPLFEAARWAPSSYNAQPWRFLYAKRGSAEWPLFFDLLIDFNKSWAKNASVLLVIVSHKVFEKNNKPSHTHSYDTGAAWVSLAIEGSSRGYVVHGMEGFNYEKAATVLQVPSDFSVEAMAAIGKRAPITTLSPELQERETPSSRKPISDIIMKGKFKI